MMYKNRGVELVQQPDTTWKWRVFNIRNNKTIVSGECEFMTTASLLAEFHLLSYPNDLGFAKKLMILSACFCCMLQTYSFFFQSYSVIFLLTSVCLTTGVLGYVVIRLFIHMTALEKMMAMLKRMTGPPDGP